jgi:ABC-type amino acid transport substrate-binding protein
MPLARIRGGAVVEGLTVDLGRLIGQRLHRDLRFVPVPRRRLADALQRGEADLVCGYLPGWLPGPFRWSRPFLPQSEWLITRADAPAPRTLADLRGQRIGTVLGFIYPELSEALGSGFVREDAPTAAANLRKLGAGRMSHASVSGRLLRYMERQGSFSAELHPPLVVSLYVTRCAVSPQSNLRVEDLDAALLAMERDGSLAAMLAAYD